MVEFRIEKDSLGAINVPKDAFYGSFTARASANFQLSENKYPRAILEQYVWLKITAAQINLQLGVLSQRKAKAIEQAGKEILNGKFKDQFQIDVFQAGGGTVYNMNVNEVLANRANQILGGKLGVYDLVHANDDVNLGQSSNDLGPTAIRLMCLKESQKLLKTLTNLEKSFLVQSKKHKNTIKSGRTHLQDALPVFFGQIFETYALSIQKSRERIQESLIHLRELGIGGTAVGTGSNTHSKFHSLMVKQLSKNLNLKLKTSKNLFYHQHSSVEQLAFMNSLSECCIEASKICNDLRLLASGPRTGFAEIILPEVEPGSSIMPGKVNPSIIEAVQMSLMQVQGYAKTTELASMQTQLELQTFMPVIAWNCLQGIELLNNGLELLNKKCIQGIQIDKEKCQTYFENSLSLVTFLAPVIGYVKSAQLAKQAMKENKSIKQIVIEDGIMTEKEWNNLMNPKQLTKANLEFLNKFKK
ncbi:MAG: aspartate ammonia-lyase [Candidatus Diapherotrites archaeon]|nr:aspartate ammonia-lyase [Candidatus Diapherotrites archaeon]